MSQMNTRRQFVKLALGVSGLALLNPQSAVAQERRRGGGAAAGGDLALPLVKPGEGMAASVNYQHKHSDVKNAALKVERQGTAWDKQYCNNCMLYTKVGQKDGEEVGKCTLFANQLVKGQGWCASWSKKA